jgi:hypothetical protein
MGRDEMLEIVRENDVLEYESTQSSQDSASLPPQSSGREEIELVPFVEVENRVDVPRVEKVIVSKAAPAPVPPLLEIPVVDEDDTGDLDCLEIDFF